MKPPHARTIVLLTLLVASTLTAQSNEAVSDGSLDTSFSEDGMVTVGFDVGGAKLDGVRAIAVQSDGKIVLAGQLEVQEPEWRCALVRLTTDGSLDDSFGTGGKVSFSFGENLTYERAEAVAIQDDGRIVVAGVAYSVNVARFALARIHPDGSLDASFSDDGVALYAYGDDPGVSWNSAYAVDLKGDGRIVVAGHSIYPYLTPYPNSQMTIVQLLEDGSLDAEFGDEGWSRVAFEGLDAWAWSFVLHQDGSIALAGRANVSDNPLQGDFALARLDDEGTLDPTFGDQGKTMIAFNLGPDGGATAQKILLQTDGKYVVAGNAGIERNVDNYDFAVARVNTDGSLDSSFGAGGKASVAFNLGLQNTDVAKDALLLADGKIVVAGWAQRSTTYDYDFAVVRLHSNGTLDSGFGTGGKAVVPFNFVPYGSDYGKSAALQRDGKILVAGRAETPTGGMGDFAVTRLHGNLTILFDGFESGDTSAWSSTVE